MTMCEVANSQLVIMGPGHPCIMKIGYHRASRGSGNVVPPWYWRVRS